MDTLHDEPSMHEDINKIAKYEDHYWMIIYPESIPWGNDEETIMSWIMDDVHLNLRNGWYLLSNRFTDIGIACDYHGAFT